MQVDPPENRGLAALMVTSGVGGLILLLAGNGGRSLVLALVAFACFIVCVALLGLGSVLQEHQRWRVDLKRQRLSEQAEGDNAKQ
ncbi:hypothetical protein EV384_0604 [Micromonospora kangleipakensis]|uniref:Uncharacterized protein n=1 Tax=Micromonospora kangleipakensis TaxID=1077942 RepID=A0A4Q8B5G0_9ACTN|nr:hypothetical protein [Micromonospora kangleipakensis]RZU72251.1 hypothetical protein EV384_0604 [Micromonospora kangleipakensis]